MLLLAMAALFVALVIVLIDGNWRQGLIVTLLIGFLQDPLRKVTPDQPSQLAGLILIGFVLSALVLISRRGRFDLPSMFWTVPQLSDWVPVYFGLILLQSVNSLARFSDPLITGIGVAFYLAPALGLWVGFQVGLDPRLLRRLLTVYLIGSAICAVTVYLSFQGYRHPLLKEVGEGILITFRYGYSAQGASGLWRTSEIASWHLSAACAIAASLGASARRPINQYGLLLLSIGFALLSILTGRRKAIVLIIVFAVIYLLALLRRASAAERDRLFANFLGSTGLAYLLFSFVIVGLLRRNFGEYLARTFSTSNELFPRFQSQGLGAISKAVELAEGFGLGVGAGAQTGNLEVTATRSVRDLSYVVEGGGGRVIVELGLPGLVLIAILGFYLFKVIRRNFRLIRDLPSDQSILLLGLLCFVIANIPLFISAAQLYGDPFVLIVMSLCLGAFLSIPALVARRQLALQAAQAHAASAFAPSPGRP